MTVYDYLARICDESNGLQTSQRQLLCVILANGGANQRCYLSTASLAAKSTLTQRFVTKILPQLIEAGWIKRYPASECDVPKKMGWVYGLFDLTSELSSPVNSVHPTKALSSENETSTPKAKKNKKNNNKELSSPVNSVPPSRSTSTSTLLLSDEMGSRGSTSRVREATGSTTQPTPSDIEQLQAEIVRALEPCDRFYKPNQAIQAVVKQNRSRVRAILAGQGSLEAAIDYVQARGVEWCMRVEHGADYAPPAILKNLAEDAEKGAWATPKDWTYTLERRIERQVQEQLEGIRKARPGWEDEHWAKLRGAGEAAAASREPMALGDVGRALVPQVDAPVVRRTPSVRAEETSRPMWWDAAVKAFDDRAVQREFGLERVGIEIGMGLEGARVVVSGSVVRVLPGVGLPLAWEEALRKHAPAWTEVLTKLAQQLGQPVRVVWAEDDTLVAQTEPSVRRAPQGTSQPALPTWWQEVGEHLHEAQKRARHHDGDHVWAQVIAQLDRLRERARAADYDPERHELVVEVETLGELREQWADCAQELARCTALALDLTRREAPSVRVVELGEVGP